MTSLAEKEGRKGDMKTIQTFKSLYWKDSKLLFYRILDELLLKESRQSRVTDFSKILSTEIFLRSVFICAIETVFFIGSVRNLQVQDLLNLVGLKAFDYWRILNSYLKFDMQMPKN